MKSLFFISIFTVTISTSITFPLQKLLNNPKLFASAFEHADKDAVGKMIKMVDDLLVEGGEDRQAAIDHHAQKTSDHNDAVDSLNDALAQLAITSGKLDVALTRKKSLTKKEADLRSAFNGATGTRVAAQGEESRTKFEMDATVERVDKETEMLGNAKTLLEGVKSGETSRRLLSDADPAAVNAVISKIDDLLAAGATEKADSIVAHDQAAANLEAAQTAEADAQAEHEAAAGALVAAQNLASQLTSQKNGETSVKNDAVNKEARAALSLADALTNMNSEIQRIDTERTTLEEVDGLLKNVLLSSFF